MSKLTLKKNGARRLNLRGLMVTSYIGVLGFTLTICLYAAHRIQSQILIDGAHEARRAYAEKVASGIDDFIYAAQRRLKYSADLIAPSLGDSTALEQEAKRLLGQDASLSSIVIMNSDGIILQMQPDSGLGGAMARSPEILKSLKDGRPRVSNVYRALSENIIVFISMPIVDGAGRNIGMIGGSIHLQERNTLHTLARDHFSRDGSVTYILDGEGTLVSHPTEVIDDSSDLYRSLTGNQLNGVSGSAESTDRWGREMIVGYAAVPLSGWHVISERSRTDTLAGLDELMGKMLLSIAPFALACLLAIWALAHLIARPLGLLAQAVSATDNAVGSERIARVRAWYREAQLIKSGLEKHMGSVQKQFMRLNSQAHTDPLTGLGNRRRKREVIRELELTGRGFSVVILDIDHFKFINDTFGHKVGDQTLIALSRLLEKFSRDGDVVCRIGGEEFMLLLPGATIDEAISIGTRLGRVVRESKFDVVGKITISMGASTWAPGLQKVSEVLEKADDLMYRAKQAGRNRLFSDLSEEVAS